MRAKPDKDGFIWESFGKDSYRVFDSRSGGHMLGFVFREPGTKRQWKVNVDPMKPLLQSMRGIPTIGCIRGTYTSRVKAAHYLREYKNRSK